jgi:hypothetical protein
MKIRCLTGKKVKRLAQKGQEAEPGGEQLCKYNSSTANSKVIDRIPID